MPRQWSLLKRISLLTLSKALERSTEWRIKVAFSLSRSTSISWVMESRAPMWGMAACCNMWGIPLPMRIGVVRFRRKV